MKKNYILDTNVLIQDEEAIYRFEDNNVYIPAAVTDELNFLKEDTRDKERAASARAANRVIRSLLNECMESGNQILDDGQGIVFRKANGGTIHFIDSYSNEYLDTLMTRDPFDSEIILAAVYIRSLDENIPTILVTNDNGMANRAISRFRLPVEEYKNQMVEASYKGRRELRDVPGDAILELLTGESIFQEDIGLTDAHENEYFTLFGDNGRFALAKAKNGLLDPIYINDRSVSGIRPANNAQKFALDALLSDTPLAIIQGPSGTGKTLLALAAGMEQLKRGKYKQILLLRPNVMLDDNDDALPGNEQEKIDPLMRPYWDNIKRILMLQGCDYKDVNDELDALIAEEKIRAESFSYIRCRNISDAYIICDESQNLLRKHAVGILTRPGESSKLVMIGDPSENQIDKPYVNEFNNGLVYAMNLMKDSEFSSQTYFYENESKRSALVKDVVNRIQQEHQNSLNGTRNRKVIDYLRKEAI